MKSPPKHLDGCRVRVADGGEVEVIMTGHGDTISARMTPDAAVALGVVLIQAAWFADHPRPEPQPEPPAPAVRKPAGRRKGGGA